ncbi:MAG: arginine--tRNA ligase [Clostridiales bacterium]|nr:arginine--tRNA ligase [Clostridiales bacterium]
MDFKLEIASLIAEKAGISKEECASFIEVPPKKEMGDLAFPCFKLARVMRKAPPVIAQELKDTLVLPAFIKQAQVEGGYLNFFLDTKKRAESVLKSAYEKGENYGASEIGKDKTVCIDYSSINIAKRCHIGHLTTTVLGNSLAKIHRFLGYNVVSINHLGDWGTQFGKMLCAFKHWGNKKDVEEKGVNALIELYVRFEKDADEDMQTEARAWFKKIEDDDAEAIELFNWFKDITLKDVQRIYDLLGIKFDSYAGESFYKDKCPAVVEELKEKNLLELSEGAYVVKLDQYQMPPCILLKSDGATIYATRDLAAIFYRKKTYDFDKCLYVVAYQQNLHFQQVFKVVEQMGYDWADSLVHVPFGMVSYEGQTLSTRKGHVVYLDEVLDRAIIKALDIINEKNPDLENKETVAKQVGIGAVVFYDLFSNRIKDVDFWWDRALNFEGETGPYVQYAHTRCCSVLKKAPEINFVKADFNALNDEASMDLVSRIEMFPQVVLDAAEKYEPSIITRFAANLAQSYNRFYFENRILGEEEPVMQARLVLTKCTRDCLKTALGLLGIEAPEKM